MRENSDTGGDWSGHGGCRHFAKSRALWTCGALWGQKWTTATVVVVVMVVVVVVVVVVVFIQSCGHKTK